MAEQVPEATEFLESLKAKMSASPVMHHPFLIGFESERLDGAQLRKFAVQWYKTARKHKEAFPALIYNVKADDVRFDLIDILNEEYGSGDREKIHARLLQRFLGALGVSDEDVRDTPTLPAVDFFGEEVLRIWRDDNEVYAFGLHFALEYLASSLHVHFADGLSKYASLTEFDTEYFNFHKVAEKQHSDFSEGGILFYGITEENRLLLRRGIETGIELLGRLWDDFQDYVFSPNSEMQEMAPA
jgi:pyrroloquinoline quinone (PQQ) biosynthesis protein C